MKSMIVFALLVAAAMSASVDYKSAQIVRSELDNIGVEGFRYAYETSDGTSAQQEGQLKNAGAENEAVVVRGQFSYVAPDGQLYTVTYVADENGFQPSAAHLPKAP